MATDTKPRRQTSSPDVTLRVSAYDSVSSALVAMILFLGFFVVLMFAIWLTKTPSMKTSPIPPGPGVEHLSGRVNPVKGYAHDLSEPGVREIEPLEDPQLEAVLESVVFTCTTQASLLDSLNTDAPSSGKGDGPGDRREPGEGDEGDAIPRQERWFIEYQSDNLDRYAQQLDFFGIELAAVGGGSKFIDYATNLSKSPVTRQGTSRHERRLYFTWNSGQLRNLDTTLLARAGIKTSDRVLIHFFPESLERQLLDVELAYALAHGIDRVEDIRQTIFRVVGSPEAYRFEVVSQVRRALRT